MSPKLGGGGEGCGVSTNEYKCAQFFCTLSPNKFWRSNSILNLWFGPWPPPCRIHLWWGILKDLRFPSPHPSHRIFSYTSQESFTSHSPVLSRDRQSKTSNNLSPRAANLIPKCCHGTGSGGGKRGFLCHGTGNGSGISGFPSYTSLESFSSYSLVFSWDRQGKNQIISS